MRFYLNKNRGFRVYMHLGEKKMFPKNSVFFFCMTFFNKLKHNVNFQKVLVVTSTFQNYVTKKLYTYRTALKSCFMRSML